MAVLGGEAVLGWAVLGGTTVLKLQKLYRFLDLTAPKRKSIYYYCCYSNVFNLNYRTLLKGSVWSKKSFPFFAENMIIRSILNL